MYDSGIILLETLCYHLKQLLKDIHCITNTGPVLIYLILLKLLQTIDITKFKHLLPNISILENLKDTQEGIKSKFLSLVN